MASADAEQCGQAPILAAASILRYQPWNVIRICCWSNMSQPIAGKGAKYVGCDVQLRRRECVCRALAREFKSSHRLKPRSHNYQDDTPVR